MLSYTFTSKLCISLLYLLTINVPKMQIISWTVRCTLGYRAKSHITKFSEQVPQRCDYTLSQWRNSKFFKFSMNEQDICHLMKRKVFLNLNRESSQSGVFRFQTWKKILVKFWSTSINMCMQQILPWFFGIIGFNQE